VNDRGSWGDDRSTAQDRSAEANPLGPDWSSWPHRTLVPPGAPSDRIGHFRGTHRIVSPESTWAVIEPLLETAGISRVADLTGLDDIGIPTAQAVRPASLVLSTSQGKASTLVAAKVSAAMEAMEGWHSENIEPDLLATSAHELVDELTYDPGQLSQVPGSLYHPHAKLDWVRATTALTGQPTWLPHHAVRLNVGLRRRWGPPMFVVDTNGLASGNSYDEAALHALFELLERDSRIRTAQAGNAEWLDLDTVTDPDCRELIDRMRSAGNAVEVFDCTAWPGYYCFDVTVRSRALGGVFGGTGLHRDPAVALSRGLTEAAQSRLTVISGAREDIPEAAYQGFGQPAPPPPPLGAVRPYPDVAPVLSTSVRQLLVEAAVTITERIGSEPIVAVIDFDRACVPVVRIMAPTMRYDDSLDIRASLPTAAA
jgi:YcaO-like protein with predicted kinase domain